MRKLSWIIAGILCTTAPMTALHAAQLGNAQVESKLTQQLKVKIPIDDVTGVSLDDIDVRLAPRSYYDQSGLSLDKVQGNLIFKVKKGKSGPYVVVTSRRPVMDPIFSFLLQVSSGNSSNIREYDLLLDPPLHRATAQKKAVVASAPAPQAMASTTKAPATPAKPRSSWVPPKSVPQVQMGATYTVKRGDTLYEIASKATQEKKVPVRGMMQAIINENPKAFPNGDGNLMLAGAKLKVPEAVVADQAKMASTPESTGNESKPKLTLLSAKGSDSTAPSNEANANSSSTETPTTSADSTATSSTSTPENANSQTENSTPAQEEPGTQAPAASMPAEKLPAIDSTQKPSATEEDIASIQAHNEAMNKQIGMLNDQLKQVQDQMTTRNERIEKLQQQVQSAESQTNQLKQKLHAQTENFWSKWGMYLTGGMGVVVIFLLLLALSNRKRNDIEPEQSSPEPKIDSDMKSSSGESGLDASDIDMTRDSAAALGEMPDPVIASGMHDDASAAIQEAQLLVSYNLHGQAIDLLKDTMDRHPDDVQVYRALAEIYAGEGRSDDLNDILDRIDTRFGADQRPDIQATQKTSANEEPIAEEHTSPVEPIEETLPDTEFSSEEDLGAELTEPESDQEKPADPLLDSIDFDSGATMQSTGLEDIDLTDEEPKAPHHEELEDLELDLGSDLESSEAETEETTSFEDAGLSLDESTAEEESLEPVEEEGVTPQMSSSSDDTRLGLAEAFLNVGDMDSFKMIADEITAEGNQDLIDKLEQIRQSHQGE